MTGPLIIGAITLLIIAPIIGLIFDLKRSKQYKTAIVFGGLVIIGILIIGVLKSIILTTVYAFSMIPLLFLFVYLSKKQD